MKKHLAFVLFFALASLLLTVQAAAQGQLSTVKGHCADINGVPIVGATVTLFNKDSSRTIKLKTDKKGDYLTIGAMPGIYNATLLDKDGKEIFHLNNFQVVDTHENVINFDLKVEATKGGVDPKVQQEHDASVKKNQKIGKLNESLLKARDAMKAKDYDTAIATMKQATIDAPTIALIWATLGDSYYGAKQYPEAIEAYKKTIELAGAATPKDPNYGDYLDSLATTYSKAGDNENALKQFDAAAAANPAGAAKYYYKAGAILTNSNQVDAANAAFDKAIAADPNMPEPYFQKGINLFGKATTDAKGVVLAPKGTAEALNKYLELAPDGPFAESAKEILQTIGAKIQNSVGNPRKGRR